MLLTSPNSRYRQQLLGNGSATEFAQKKDERMQLNNLPRLLECIEQLITQRLETKPEAAPIQIGNDPAVFEDILNFGVYPPGDPASVPRRALLAIGETLGAIGGFKLMKQVHDAYEGKYGHHRAAVLSVRWDTAAGVRYD